LYHGIVSSLLRFQNSENDLRSRILRWQVKPVAARLSTRSECLTGLPCSKTFCTCTGYEEICTPTPFGNKEQRFACHEAILAEAVDTNLIQLSWPPQVWLCSKQRSALSPETTCREPRSTMENSEPILWPKVANSRGTPPGIHATVG
jgi:hypothetical protein